MELRTDGTRLDLQAGRLAIKVSHVPEMGSGSWATFELESNDPPGWREFRLRLEPWQADHYELYDWAAGNAMVMSGTAIVVVSLEPPHAIAVMGIEHEEVDTMARPWFVEIASEALIVATERRVWCVDPRPSIRWCWHARTTADFTFLRGSPQIVNSQVVVPLRSKRGDSVCRLDLRDGMRIPD